MELANKLGATIVLLSVSVFFFENYLGYTKEEAIKILKTYLPPIIAAEYIICLMIIKAAQL